MFSRSKGSGGRSGSGGDKRAAPSIISADLRVIGDLHSDGEIQVDGAIDGDVRSAVLLVGETAVIKGEIIADVVKVHGTIRGQIKGKAVSLAKTAHVVGDVLHEVLSIENGAFLEGHCRRLEPADDARLLEAPAVMEARVDGPSEGRINLVVGDKAKPAKPAKEHLDGVQSTAVASAS